MSQNEAEEQMQIFDRLHDVTGLGELIFLRHGAGKAAGNEVTGAQ